MRLLRFDMDDGHVTVIVERGKKSWGYAHTLYFWIQFKYNYLKCWVWVYDVLNCYDNKFLQSYFVEN